MTNVADQSGLLSWHCALYMAPRSSSPVLLSSFIPLLPTPYAPLREAASPSLASSPEQLVFLAVFIHHYKRDLCGDS